MLGRILRDLDAVVCHEESSSGICLVTVPPGQTRPGAPTCIVLDRYLSPARERWLLARAIAYILLDNSRVHVAAGFGERLDELDDLTRTFAGWLLIGQPAPVYRAPELARDCGLDVGHVRSFLLQACGSAAFTPALIGPAGAYGGLA